MSHQSEALENLEKMASAFRRRPTTHTMRDDGYDDGWPPLRKFLGKVVTHSGFDSSLCVLILANMVLLVVETDQVAADGRAEDWVKRLNYILISIYCIELIIRLYVYRLEFFEHWLNIADMIIVLVDIAFETMNVLIGDTLNELPSVVVLRIFRVLRLGRSHKALQLFPELRVMIMGLVGGCKAIFWGMLLLFMVLLIWSIIAVQMIHPLNKKLADQGAYQFCDRCPRAFESVPQALLTFTQHIVAGDSWGNVSVTIIEHYPATYLFFFLVLLTMGMAILNTILAVVIDSAQSARKETDHQIVEMRNAEFKRASEALVKVCEQLDQDRSGSLTLEELCQGYETNVEFSDAMSVLDISPEDMKTVFTMMDTDGSGDVKYDEFTKEIYKIKKSDSHTLLVFIKHYVVQLRQALYEHIRRSNDSAVPSLASSDQLRNVAGSSRDREQSQLKPTSCTIDNVTLLESISKAVERLELNTKALSARFLCDIRCDPSDGDADSYSPHKLRQFPEPRLKFRT